MIQILPERNILVKILIWLDEVVCIRQLYKKQNTSDMISTDVREYIK